MTRRATRTLRAETDLAEIVAYIAADNPAAALRLARTLDAKGQLLAEHPGIGRSYPGRPVRLFPVGNYLIVYRETPDGIEVVRYLHGRRDVRRIL